MNEAASRHPAEPEVWVVVASRGGGAEPPYDRPIVMETEVDGATRDEAMRRAGQFERRFGSCRIARLVFDEPTTTKGA